MAKKFTKKIENFKCEKCRKEVIGNGYTNHCPNCLYSKHVDIFPGDRKEKCEGLMKAIKVEMEKGEWILTHQCEKCIKEKRNKVSPKDDLNKIQEITKEFADSKFDS